MEMRHAYSTQTLNIDDEVQNGWVETSKRMEGRDEIGGKHRKMETMT